MKVGDGSIPPDDVNFDAPTRSGHMSSPSLQSPRLSWQSHLLIYLEIFLPIRRPVYPPHVNEGNEEWKITLRCWMVGGGTFRPFCILGFAVGVDTLSLTTGRGGRSSYRGL